MGAEIDRLEIQVESQAAKANNSLDKLVGKLNILSNSLERINISGLSGLSLGVKQLSSSMQGMKSVSTADFTRLAKNVEKLGGINTASLNQAAASMQKLTTAFNSMGKVSANAQQVGVLAGNLSRLGYKSISNAVTNLPVLTRELNNLLVTLSKAPTVSSNVIQMTNALANFSNQGSKVGSAARSLQGTMGGMTGSFSGLYQSLKKVSDRITIFGNSANKAAKKTKTFSSAIGTLYSKFWMLQRGLSGLWKSIEKSMDYVEVLNYFDEAFGQVAEKAVGSWKEAGYSSAEAYAESFSTRAKQLTSKMTGFNIMDSGVLETTGMPSLGLNPSTVMNYQAMFGQMSSSMGVAAETSLKLSNALTMIGADLASVKNMDFEKVWNDMASGLAGMSRTLDKYGVNIRNVNLQQKLMELGIDANISALNQNDKALLRAIILLENTKYAWGDLAETINQPANQIRLLSANLQNLSRMIGNLFLPIVAKVLPYLNGFVIALQRLVTWVGKLFGIDIGKLTSSIGSGGGEIGDWIDGVGDSLDDAAGSAKKLKQQLQGFDSLNVLSSATDTSNLNLGGLGGLLDAAFNDALDDYLAAWNEAFDEMENKAQEIADAIEAFAKKVFEPIQKAWDAEGKFVMDSWKFALEEVSGLIGNIGQDLMTVWQQDATVAIFEDIFHIVGDIGLVIGNIAEGIDEAWNKNQTGLKILENIRDIIGIAVDYFRQAADEMAGWSENLNFSPLFEAFEGLTAELAKDGGMIDSLSGIMYDFYTTVLLPLGKWVLEEGLPDLLNVLTNLANTIDWKGLREDLQGLWEYLKPFAERVGEGLILFIEDAGGALAEFVNSDTFSDFLKDVGGWMDGVSAEDVANALENIAKAIISLKVAVKGFEIVGKGALVLKSVFEIIETFAKFTRKIKALAETIKIFISSGGLMALFSSLNPGMIGEMGIKIGDLLTGSFLDPREWDNWIGDLSNNIYDLINNTIDEGVGRLKEFLITTLSIENTMAWADKAYENFKKGGFHILEGILDGFVGAIILIPEFVVNFFEAIWNEICNIFGIHSPAENMKPLGENILLGIVEGFTSQFQAFTDAISLWWEESVSPWFTSEKWSELWQGVEVAFNDSWNRILEWWKTTAIYSWWENDVKPWFSKETWIKAMDGVGTAFKEVWGSAISSVKGIWNKFATWLNSKLKLDIPPVTIMGQTVLEGMTVDLGKIPTFSVGGFPEDGLFMANHNELVGQFSNGQTVVANNEQIIEGIKRGVYEAVYSAMSANRNTSVLRVEGDPHGMFKVIQEEAYAEYKQTQSPVFP